MNSVFNLGAEDQSDFGQMAMMTIVTTTPIFDGNADEVQPSRREAAATTATATVDPMEPVLRAWTPPDDESDDNPSTGFSDELVEAVEQVSGETPAIVYPEITDTGRDATIKRIKAALKARSGKTWSVTGGKGTAWGWIEIDAPPKRRTWRNIDTGKKDEDGRTVYEEQDRPDEQFGHTGPEDREELGRLLGLDRPAHHQGESIAASSGHRIEYIDRAEGRIPRGFGEQYWD